MNLQVIDRARHRNGVMGVPFTVYLVDDDEEGGRKVIVRFDEQDGCPRTAVLSVDLLARGEIRFAHNSWRGDHYEWALRDAGETVTA